MKCKLINRKLVNYLISECTLGKEMPRGVVSMLSLNYNKLSSNPYFRIKYL